MTEPAKDDLVEQLRNASPWLGRLAVQAADTITALRAEVAALRAQAGKNEPFKCPYRGPFGCDCAGECKYRAQSPPKNDEKCECGHRKGDNSDKCFECFVFSRDASGGAA